jgi:Ca2+-binding EF-hand superfamily protein
LFVFLVSFKLYDVNHDNFLTREELERVMLKLVNKYIVKKKKKKKKGLYLLIAIVISQKAL